MALAVKQKKIAIAQVPWSAPTPKPVVLITGPENLLAERAAHFIREKLRTASPDLEVSDIDAAQYAPGELLTLASPSLFAEPRLIRVTHTEKASDAFITETLAYLASPADDTFLVLRHAGGVRAKKLLDAIRGGLGNGIEVVCSQIKRESDKFDFVAGEFGLAHRPVTPGAIRALVAAFAEDLAELASACRQLLDDTEGEVTEAVVHRYYAGRSQVNAFAVADAAIMGHRGNALALARHCLATGTDPVPLVAAFAVKIRTIAKVFGARGSTTQLASSLGMQNWQVERARRDAQGWSDTGLIQVIEALAETEAQVKGAGRDPVYALEQLIELIAKRGIVS